MSTSIPIDITDEVRAQGHLTGEHYNDGDRVYRYAGQLVKLKTAHEPQAEHGEEFLRVSGSIVGADGKALIREDGKPAVYKFGRHVTIKADDPTNVVADLERARFACVKDTVTAHDHYNQVRGLTGVARASAPATLPDVAAQMAEAHEHRRAALAMPPGEPLEPDEDPAQADGPQLVDSPPPAADKHPSGRKYLLFPGHVIHAETGQAQHLTGKALAAARAVSLSSCVVFSPKRPGAYYAGLEPIYPAPCDLTPAAPPA